jgi:multiple sugar transport system substrate-binding protein
VKILMAVLLAGFFLAGCDQHNRDRVVFSVGGAPAELAAWQELVDDFQERSGIAVELLRQPAETGQQRQGLILALKAGLKDPDVFLMDVGWVGLFAASEWLEPLTGIDRSSFFQEVLELVDIHEGQLLALPVYMDGGLLYYRRDLLERRGRDTPPTTWEELLADCLAIQPAMRETNPNFHGFVWQGAQYEGLITSFLEFAGSEGGFVLRDGRVLLDVPANRVALRFMHDLIRHHRVSPPSVYTEMREEEVRLFFQRGDALFARNWPYAWRLHQQPGSPVADRTGIAPPPGPKEGERVSTLGGWHIAVSRFSDRKKEALEFVRFVTSREGQQRMVLALGWNPGRRDLYDDPDILREMPYLAELKEVFEKARPRPNVPYYPQISEIAQRHLNGALAGQITPEEALRQAETEIAALMTRYGM